MKTINRSDLVQQLADKYGYTKKSALTLVDDFTQIILDNIREGNEISIFGFGCFTAIERKERSCPNPRTGEKCVIPAHYIPKFYPYKNMRLAVKIAEDKMKRKSN